MKINWNRRYTTIAVYAFLVIAAALLLGLLLSGYFKSFFALLSSVGKALLPFLYGFVLAFFTIPLTEKFDALIFRLSKKKKPESRGRRIVAMLLAYAVVLLVVVGLLMLIIPQLVDSIATLVSNFSTYTDRIREIVDNLSHGMSASTAEFWENMVTKGYAMLNDYLSDVVTKITKQIDGMKNQRSRILLSCRYIRHEKWVDIQKELAYEHTSIMRMHKKALKEFERTYPEIRKL